ncbi:hypothetical protein JAB6_01720 [Janthinobacterium sp. HH104]|uniref:hypothetical protein n=1 Tax=Janthinobacterium sp. HH104 TaxID=1537276 RepID=UPI000873700D|nr:hypothetical protein [Janthinobacterium sp. HH104]OEZ88810.1 hypothetical protein JAB6_01720 [Janthinobacterium sp. HH104]
MRNFYSMSTGGFYPESKRAVYEMAGTWPEDAAAVTAEEEAALRASTLVDESFAVLSARYFDSVRTTREVVLNRLAGIGMAALANDDAATVQAIHLARADLLDITSCAAVVAAQNIAALQAAVSAEYARIAATLPDEGRRAFTDAGITLAAPVTS